MVLSDLKKIGFFIVRIYPKISLLSCVSACQMLLLGAIQINARWMMIIIIIINIIIGLPLFAILYHIWTDPIYERKKTIFFQWNNFISFQHNHRVVDHFFFGWNMIKNQLLKLSSKLCGNTNEIHALKKFTILAWIHRQ